MNQSNKIREYYAKFLLCIMFINIFNLPNQSLFAHSTSHIYVDKKSAEFNNNDYAPKSKIDETKIENLDLPKKEINTNNAVHQIVMLTDKQDQGGPSTPEVQKFTPASHSSMVDPFTGDFTYNIPLFDVEGYPVNLAYSGNIGVNDEASWVGLGWNLNPGAISRNVRGLPDDFNGDNIVKEINMKPKEVLSLGVGGMVEITGLDILALGLGTETEVEYDSYDGFGIKAGLKGSFKLGNEKLSGSLSATAGIDSRSGGYLRPAFGLSASAGGESVRSNFGANVGMDINSSQGLKQVTYGLSHSLSVTTKNRENESTTASGIGRVSSTFPVSYTSPSFTPSIELETKSEAYQLHFSIGGEGTVVHAAGDINGSYSKESFIPFQSKKSFGYMYAQNSNQESLMDINRENDGPYFRELPNLPVTAFTHDIYSVSGQGISGSYRPMRGDVGMVHDNLMVNTAHTFSAGGEVGFGNLVHGGVDVEFGTSNSQSSVWKEGNAMAEKLQFKDSIDNRVSAHYEPVYFKNIGEITQMNNKQQFDKFGGYEPVRVELHEGDVFSIGEAKDKLKNIGSIENTNTTLRVNRESRNSMFTWKTIEEQRLRGHYFSAFRYFQRGSFIGENLNDFNESTSKKPHHIAEVSITEPTGARYIFGLPAYNLHQEEVSFNVNQHAPELSNGNVEYQLNSGTTKPMPQGKSHYYSKTSTPAHAYAWLLTSVVSEDYQDLLNDGPSRDDLGNYTSFKYEKAEKYNWRTNTEMLQAKYQEGSKSDKEDNKGHFVYGEKEVYYVHEIASKNYIATFHSSDRNDALGVVSFNGGINNSCRLKKLDSIRVYTLEGYKTKDPIKSIYFEYDYSLAPGQANTLDNKGKLTLKKLWFQYQNSGKGKLHPYQFFYSYNPAYHPKNIDRWGNYKEQQPGYPNNDDFPYTIQNKSIQDKFSRAWVMDSIVTPTGASLGISFESDDYSYVQDKKATVMHKILGVGKTITGPLSNMLYTSEAGSNRINRYLFFELQGDIPADRNNYLLSLLNGLDNLYYSVDINVLKGVPNRFETLQGFIPNQERNLTSITSGNAGFLSDRVAYITLPYVNKNGGAGNEWNFTYGSSAGDILIHPFTKAGVEMVRYAYPHTITSPYGGNMTDFTGAVEAFGNAAANAFSGGEENYLIDDQRCNEINLENAFIRLNTPYQRKLGGGNRVKEVRLYDNWGKLQIGSENPYINAVYGSTYTYLDDQFKSSGVASYEPIIGGDENVFVQPVPYKIIKEMSADLNKYQLEPLGQIFFPGAQVGYAKVTERSIYPKNVPSGFQAKSSGTTVSEFYTARDFPTITKRTDLSSLHREVIIPLQFYNRRLNASTVSQGFYIEINNMHGKSKKSTVYDAKGTEIEVQIQKYKLNEDGTLDNNVSIVNPSNGDIENKTLGVDYEIIADSRLFRAKTNAGAVQVNIENFFIAAAPIVIPIPIPAVTDNLSEYRGLTITKVIMRSGILEETTTIKLGANNTSKTLAYDGITGQAIVTMTEDEFKNNYYNTAIPAYWYYKNMGPAAQNERALKKNVNITNSQITGTWASDIFNEGDELSLLNQVPGIPSRAWVFKKTSDKVHLITASGYNDIPNGNYNVLILKSGFKNNLTSSLGNILSYENPIKTIGGSNRLSLNPTKVISSSYQTYSDYWQTNKFLSVSEARGSCLCKVNKYTSTGINKLLGLVRQYQTGELAWPSGATFHSSQISLPADGSFFVLGTPNNTDCTIELRTQDGSPFPVNLSGQFTLDFKNDRCDAPSEIILNFQGQSKDLPNIIVSTNCYNLIVCQSQGDIVSANCTPTVINPFLNGVIGRFKPLASYTPATTRTNTSHVQGSGFLERYEPFARWGDGKLDLAIDDSYWQITDSLSVINSSGAPLETINALKVPNSTFYGFNNIVPMSVAAIAKYSDIAFDGFEDYGYYEYDVSATVCKIPDHFHGDASGPISTLPTDGDESHAGKNSMKVTPVWPLDYKFMVNSIGRIRAPRGARFIGPKFSVDETDLVKVFTPSPGKYTISAWVKAPDLSQFSITYKSVVLKPSGPIIDGWQQIVGEIDITASTDQQKISINSGTSTGWVDDVRIYPTNAMMESYAVDPTYLRIHATLDYQNYAKYFEYNHEGQLTRSKVKTEEGVFTVQEIKSELPKINR